MRNGFTLIELLVVVTIIVVLLALLAPALDKAIYQAELAVCGTQLHGIGRGAMTYAFDHKRIYPPNPGMDTPYDLIKANAPRDLRPAFRGYIPLEMLLDPLAGKLDLTKDYSNRTGHYQVFVPRVIWFGWSYGDQGTAGMTRLGGRVTYGGSAYNMLASDMDTLQAANGLVYNSHPDHDGLQWLDTHEDASGVAGDFASGDTGGAGITETATWWRLTGSHERGPVDMNHAYGDGSVRRFNDVAWDDWTTARMDRVPVYIAGAGASGYPANYWQLPAH